MIRVVVTFTFGGSVVTTLFSEIAPFVVVIGVVIAARDRKS